MYPSQRDLVIGCLVPETESFCLLRRLEETTRESHTPPRNKYSKTVTEGRWWPILFCLAWGSHIWEGGDLDKVQYLTRVLVNIEAACVSKQVRDHDQFQYLPPALITMGAAILDHGDSHVGQLPGHGV